MSKENYNLEIFCRNCDNLISFYVPKGMTSNTFFRKKENKFCKICGCKHGG